MAWLANPSRYNRRPGTSCWLDCARLGQGAPALNVEVTAPAQPGVQQVLESLAACLQDSFLPLIKVMDRKIDVDLRTHNRINEISSRLDELGRLLGGEQRPLENDQP